MQNAMYVHAECYDLHSINVDQLNSIWLLNSNWFHFHSHLFNRLSSAHIVYNLLFSIMINRLKEWKVCVKHTFRVIEYCQKCLVLIHVLRTIALPFQSMIRAQSVDYIKSLYFLSLDVDLLPLSTSQEYASPSQACKRWIQKSDAKNYGFFFSYLKKWNLSLVVPLKFMQDWMQQWRTCGNVFDISMTIVFFILSLPQFFYIDIFTLWDFVYRLFKTWLSQMSTNTFSHTWQKKNIWQGLNGYVQ